MAPGAAKCAALALEVDDGVEASEVEVRRLEAEVSPDADWCRISSCFGERRWWLLTAGASVEAVPSVLVEFPLAAVTVTVALLPGPV
jgi:hypothetical protein